MKIRQGDLCVITGAAGGFGRAIALVLARRQTRLVLADIDASGLEQTQRLALAAGAQSCNTLCCDVSRFEDIQRLSEASPGEVALLVNNAGVSTGGKIGELPLEDWRWTLDVDLWGVIYGCHVFVPRLRAQTRGHILNVASAAGFMFAPKMAAYNVAKAGVIALSDTLSTELADTPIRVTALCPTFFKTQIATAGRFSDEETRQLAQALVSQGASAEAIARKALQAVERNRRYCVPTVDAALLWQAKRLFPELLGRLLPSLERIQTAVLNFSRKLKSPG